MIDLCGLLRHMAYMFKVYIWYPAGTMKYSYLDDLTCHLL